MRLHCHVTAMTSFSSSRIMRTGNRSFGVVMSRSSQSPAGVAAFQAVPEFQARHHRVIRSIFVFIFFRKRSHVQISSAFIRETSESTLIMEFYDHSSDRCRSDLA